MDNLYRFARSRGRPPNVEDWTLIDAFLVNRDRFLEIGVAEGRSIIETCNLFNNNTEMYCVDSWRTPEEGEANFDYNLNLLKQTYTNTFYKIKEMATTSLAQFILSDIKFDFIYNDSVKIGKRVMEHFTMSFLLLNDNGIMMMDDYYLDRKNQDPLETSKMAIDMMLFQYSKHLKVLHRGKRCIIQKTKR